MKTLSTSFGMALVLGVGAGQALAATWTVNTTVDSTDAAPGDGVCADYALSGQCSLRAAVMEANAFPDLDTIVLPDAVYRLDIPSLGADTESNGDLDILGPLTIEGGGATVEWWPGVPFGERDRVFHLHQASYAQIQALTIRGGVATLGGGILIQQGATLYLDNVTVEQNRAFTQGGGVWSQGNLTMQDSTISANRAEGTGGVGPFGGGGLYNVGNVHVLRSTFSGNLSPDGGGGGILNEDGGVLTMVNSTISSNHVFMAGGGLFNRGDASLSFVTNSFNVVDDGPGGGLLNVSVLKMAASILAINVPQDCATLSAITNGFNLDSDSSCNLAATGDISGVDPLLGALQIDPHRLTRTHALLPGSPAFDRVTAPCLDLQGNEVAEDQRGRARPAPDGGDRCDIGAVEGLSDLLFRDGFDGVAARMRR